MKINIFYNQSIDPIYIKYIHSHEKWKDIVVPTKEEVLEKVKSFIIAWDKIEKPVLEAMCQITGLSFTRNLLDVNVVSLNPRPTSRPLVIKSGWEPEEFVKILAHEVLANLHIDNTPAFKKIWKHVKSKYKESDTTVTHVFVYAILNEITRLTGIDLKEKIMFSEINKDYILAQKIAEKDSEWVLSGLK